MKIPSKINVGGTIFHIKKDKNIAGASFTFETRTITYNHTFSENEIKTMLIHEISEIIHVTLGTRLYSPHNDSYVFIMDHKEFQAHNDILVNTLVSNKIIQL